MDAPAPRTRIQEKNRAAILDAALDVFSQAGFRGATLDKIAGTAGLSKPNLLYYFASKNAIYVALLSGLLDQWLDPLKKISANGDPIEEIVGYVQLKLQMSRKFPRESRLFANEILEGAPRIQHIIEGPLKELVDDKCALIRGWSQAGTIVDVDPYHLIFSIWATTQHYADFDTQVVGILGPGKDHHSDAARFLEQMFRSVLAPR